MTLERIYSTIFQLKFQSNVKLVCIDFLTRIDGGDVDEYNFLRRATKYIKDMAKELGVAIIVVAQTGREGGGAGFTPLRLSSARGSGTIEEDADFIFGVHRPELNPMLSPEDRFKVRDQLILQMLGSRRTELIPSLELYFNKTSLRIMEMGKPEEELRKKWNMQKI